MLSAIHVIKDLMCRQKGTRSQKVKNFSVVLNANEKPIALAGQLLQAILEFQIDSITEFYLKTMNSFVADVGTMSLSAE